LANPFNFRRHPKAQQDGVSGSLNDLGWIQRIIVNRATGHVIDGHARVELAISRGEPSVPVVYVDVTPEEERKALAVFDALGALAAIDGPKLGELLASISTEDPDLERMLTDLASANGVTYGAAAEEPPEDPGADLDHAEELREKWGVERGQLWEVGRHRVMCGDSSMSDDMAYLMGAAVADCMWTDPPYGVDYVGKTADALVISNDGAEGLPILLTAVFQLSTIHLVLGSPVYTAAPPGPLWRVAYDAFHKAFQFHQGLVWVKDVFVLGHSDYHYQHENILYGWTAGEGRSGRGAHDGTRWYGDHAQASVFQIPRPKRSEDHPTMKPLDLVVACLRNSTRRGDAVLDPFCGSGTTLVAAEHLGLRGYGVELKETFTAVILERLSLMGLTPKLVDP
jgi:DNA modification methylase